MVAAQIVNAGGKFQRLRDTARGREETFHRAEGRALRSRLQ